MTINSEDMLKSILASLDRIEHVEASSIPEIDLYMDQVLTFMDQHMKQTTRDPEEDKILTKTMINNYAKNEIIPAPDKKKYGKEHIIILIYIYYLKGFLSIGDIATLLDPMKENFFGKKDREMSMADVYDRVFLMEDEKKEKLKKEISDMYESAMKEFEDAPEADRLYLQMFDFVSKLSYDVYVKKLLIEKLIDLMNPEEKARGTKEKGSKEKREK